MRKLVAFEDVLKLLREYREQHGHCNVPQNHKVDDINLGVIVHSIRRGNRKTTAEQKAMLDSIGFVWKAKEPQIAFEDVLKLLREYREQHGHCNVPKNHKVGNINLGVIVSHIRYEDRKTTSEQKAMLDSIGFVWKVNNSPYSFEDAFKLLKEYREQHGHCNVPRNHKVGDIHLGIIVHNIRKGRRKTTLKQKQMLDSIGFVWKAKESQIAFEDVLKLLREYREQHGHCNVPTNNKVDDINLGVIVHSIRSGKRKTTAEQKAMLDSIGFVWKVQESFEDVLKLLKEYKEKHGHCNVPTNHKVDDINLGMIVRNIRSGSRKTTAEQKAMLDSIGFVWKMRERKSNTPN